MPWASWYVPFLWQDGAQQGTGLAQMLPYLGLAPSTSASVRAHSQEGGKPLPQGPPAATILQSSHCSEGPHWGPPARISLCIPGRARGLKKQLLAEACDSLPALPGAPVPCWYHKNLGLAGGLVVGKVLLLPPKRQGSCLPPLAARTRCCCHLTALGETAFGDSAVFIPARGPTQRGFPWKTSIQNKERRSYSGSDSATTGSFCG